jgi:hypothetical protein
MPWASRVVVDTTQIAVFPFQYPTSLSSAKLQLEQRVEAELVTWSGVKLTDPGQLVAVIGVRQPADLSRGRAAEVAGGLGAGRYIRGEISVIGDSLQVHTRLYGVDDTHDPMMDDVVKLPVTLDGLDPAVRGVVARLLLREEASPATEVGASHSLPAMQAWLRGRRALDMWRLDEADSALTRAVKFDTSFARPALWLAVVRNWTGAPPAQWSGLVERALNRNTNLTAHEASVGAALSAEQSADWDRACSDWRALTISDPTDFTMSFGLASCLRKDDAVIRDASSSSGWRFRASAQEMVQAYRRAFERVAIPRDSWRAGRLDKVPDLLFARSNLVRIGRTLPGGHLMVADPGWAADSLEFVPEPYDSYNRGAEGTRAATRREALRQQRRLLHEIAATWVATVPKSPLALEALAVALKLLEDPAALDTLRLARSLAVAPTDRVRLAAQEVWFRLTAAAPDDSVELRRIHDLADSLLRGVGSASNPDDAAALVGLAALLGRVDLAARLAGGVGSAGEAPQVRSLSQDGPALLTYSAFGGPVARILALEQSVTSSMNATALKVERDRTLQAWLQQAARIAFPDVRFATLQSLARENDALLEAQASLALGDADPARLYLANRAAFRRLSAPENISFDNLYPEARLFVLLGDSGSAARWLDPALNAVQRADPHVLSRLTNAAALVRAATLRADLAIQLGDSVTAIRWARVVTILWDTADEFLQPIVRRMKRLVQASPSNTKRS